MIESFVLRIKRRETPFFQFLYGLAKGVNSASLPLPRFFHPALRMLYACHQGAIWLFNWAMAFFYYEPLFRGRCESVGKRFSLVKLPFVKGHTKIYIGDDVRMWGKVDIFSGRTFDEPKLILHNRVSIGHGSNFHINKEVVIEEGVNIAGNVSIRDTDAHPRNFADRIAGLPPGAGEIRPIRICRNAWIGNDCYILKGVTIGEGAIVGAGSVVMTDIPPHSVAMGNPARVVMKNPGLAAEGSRESQVGALPRKPPMNGSKVNCLPIDDLKSRIS